MKTYSLTRHALALGLLSATGAACADDAPPANNVTVGIAGVNSPRYSGADKQHWSMVPVFQARDGAFFVDSQKGIGYDLQADNGLYLEHTLGYGLGRDEKDSQWRDGSDKLKGMGKIKSVANTAIAVGWSVTPWLVLEGKATLPLTDGQGVQYRPSVTLIPWQTATDTVALQMAGLFGDARYMNTFYGVSAEQSQRSGYARYDAPGGFYSTDTSLTWSHQFPSGWGTSVTADYTWLGDHAKDSPIVSRRDGLTSMLALTYSF